MRLFFLCLFLFYVQNQLFSQEIHAVVEVITIDIVNDIDKSRFQRLEDEINAMVNNTRWTNDRYTVNEKIESTIAFQITGISGDNITANFTLISKRPVHGTSYFSELLNVYESNMTFKYGDYETLNYVEGEYRNNISSIISFYVFILLGMDADSFQMYSGEPYYEKANDIALLVNDFSDERWKEIKSKESRRVLIREFTDERNKPLRKFLYLYYRNGLDFMVERPIDVPNNIHGDLMELKTFSQEVKDNRNMIRLLFRPKGKEIARIFQKYDVEKNKLLSEFLISFDNENRNYYRSFGKNFR